MSELINLSLSKKQRNPRTYYGASIQTFLSQTSEEILGEIHRNCPLSDISLLQRNTWEDEIYILKR